MEEHEEADGILSVTSITSATLAAPPSCIEFSKRDAEIFVVGTYSLEEGDQPLEGGTQARSGSLLVFRWTGEDL